MTHDMIDHTITTLKACCFNRQPLGDNLRVAIVAMLEELKAIKSQPCPEGAVVAATPELAHGWVKEQPRERKPCAT